jgi:hypothetical protein
MENMTILNMICRMVGMINVRSKAKGLTRKHLLPPYPNLSPSVRKCSRIPLKTMGRIGRP